MDGAVGTMVRNLLKLTLAALLVLPSCDARRPADTVEGAVVALAKAKGWRTEFTRDLNLPHPLLEIAFDGSTAARAWDENVPDDLKSHEEHSVEPGLYGSLDDVNFETHAVAVWTSGESGTCPETVVRILPRVDGRIDIHTYARGGVCSDDFSYYRMVLAVERSRLPVEDDLPAEAHVDGDPVGRIVLYPFTGD